MSYKSEIASNNESLRSVLDTVNSLPDNPNAGGSFETVAISGSTQKNGPHTLYYTNANGEAVTAELSYGSVVANVAKNKICFVGGSIGSAEYVISPDSAATIIGASAYIMAFVPMADCAVGYEK